MLELPFLDQLFNRKLNDSPTILDGVDKMHFGTTFIMVVLAGLLTGKQYFGSPINCWTEKYFAYPWDEYVKDYCFISNSYYVPQDHGNYTTTFDKDHSEYRTISYYPWVPIALAIQALCFMIPSYAALAFFKRTDLNPNQVLEEANKIRKKPGLLRKMETERLARYIRESFRLIKDNGRVMFGLIKAQVSVGYIMFKFMTVFNTFVQISFISYLLDDSYSAWAREMIAELFTGSKRHESRMFPLNIICTFAIRVKQGIHRFSVPCIVSMNFYNETVYFFLFIWFSLLAICGTYSLISTLLFMLDKEKRANSVKIGKTVSDSFVDSLNSTGLQTISAKQLFACDYLGEDGVLLLHLIRNNVDRKLALELTEKLYEGFVEEQGLTMQENGKANSTCTSVTRTSLASSSDYPR